MRYSALFSVLRLQFARSRRDFLVRGFDHVARDSNHTDDTEIEIDEPFVERGEPANVASRSPDLEARRHLEPTAQISAQVVVRAKLSIEARRRNLDFELS